MMMPFTSTETAKMLLDNLLTDIIASQNTAFWVFLKDWKTFEYGRRMIVNIDMKAPMKKAIFEPKLWKVFFERIKVFRWMPLEWWDGG